MPPDTAGAAIGFGKVAHMRLHPLRRRFVYAVFCVRLPVHALAGVGNRFFSVDRFNLLSFHQADHGRGGDALAWARDLLRDHGLADDGDIWLTTFPRVLGYAFKPVSFWHCHASDGRQVAVLVEVNNTFGERHVYLLRSDDPAAPLRADKVFHVSPFFPVRGHYVFRFDLDATRFRAGIDYHDGGGEALRTAWWGALEPLSARACLRAFFGYPLMTWGVIARIHLQALHLFARRVPFFRKPPAPLDEITE